MVDREMLAAMEELLDRKLDEKLEEKLDQKFKENLQPVNDRLDRLDGSVQKLDERVSKLEESTSNLDRRMGKLEDDVTFIKVVQLENGVIPRLHTIEGHYLEASDRYVKRTDQFDDMVFDISVLKSVVQSHSDQLRKAQ